MDAVVQGRPQDSHAVNIDSLAQQLTQELAAAADASSLPRSCGDGRIIISHVANLTRNVDPAEYEPHHVSIGPYSRIRKPGLTRDEEKIRSLATVLSAANTGATLKTYLEELARLEVEARRWYAHSFVDMDSDRFLRMLLLDACYLLVRFAGVAADDGRRVNVQVGYRLGGTPVTAASTACGGGDRMEALAVVRDVFYLAENQIPFLVIDKILRLTFQDGGSSAADAIRTYARALLANYTVATPSPRCEPGNLLDLLHMHFVKPNNINAALLPAAAGDRKMTGERVDRWRTATEYHFAGVKFRKRRLRPDDGVRCILHVRLSSGGGVLEVPRLNIDAETWRLLRNLMELEQRNPEVAGSHVTAYCVFMSQLACTPADVELLSRSGVIVHGLGTNGDVARCFADLCRGIMFSVNDRRGNYLRPTCLALDRRFRSRHRRWVTWLRMKYFRNPWLAVGLAAAVVGLVCTVVQAVYSVLSYKQAQ